MSLIYLFKKIKHWNLEIIGYWLIRAGCEIEKDLEHSPSVLVLVYIDQLAKFGDLITWSLKNTFKNAACLM